MGTDDSWVLAEAGAVVPAYGATLPTEVDTPSPQFYDIPPLGYAMHSVANMYAVGYTPKPRMDSFANADLRAFYAAQNDLLDMYIAAAAQHPTPCVTRAEWAFLKAHASDMAAERSDDRAQERQVQRAIIMSNVCNALLMVAQLYAFVTSGALSLLAVFVDAVLDMVSGLVVMGTWYMRKLRDKYRYPVGRSRLEPLGVIGMACLMTAATLVTLEQAISCFFSNGTEPVRLSLVNGGILLSALAVKFALYHYCTRVNNDSVQALAQDHFNDCMSNAVSFCTVLAAQHFVWWVDPLGGIVISLLIIRNWTLHTLEHCDQLLGKAAGREVINVVTFMACNHHPDVSLVDTVRAYHVGNGIYVEVDIVLAAEMPLHQAHDIGEHLQARIEKMEPVERCFVHIDTEARHSPAIEHKEL